MKDKFRNWCRIHDGTPVDLPHGLIECRDFTDTANGEEVESTMTLSEEGVAISTNNRNIWIGDDDTPTFDGHRDWEGGGYGEYIEEIEPQPAVGMEVTETTGKIGKHKIAENVLGDFSDTFSEVEHLHFVYGDDTYDDMEMWL